MSIILFPGQGSQYQGMAIDFDKKFKISKEIFEEIEDSTKINIRKIISENIDNKLNQTNFTQIAIFAVSIVIYKTLLDQFGFEKIRPEIVLGHSLGEYSALVANNALTLNDASNLIKIRGELMNSAIKPNISGMAAVIGKDAKFIDEIIDKNKLNLEIANDNSPVQVVVSGLIEDINLAEGCFISEGVKRYIKLNVSAAFHSKYMLEAQNKLNLEIEKISFSSCKIPIISNYSAKLSSNLDDIMPSLKKQMSSRVRWTEGVTLLENSNVVDIIEIGPNKILSGLVSRISKKFDIKSIDKVEDLEKLNY